MDTIYEWITAKVTFGYTDRVVKTFKVENCSYVFGTDLLEKMIEAYEDNHKTQAIRTELKHSRLGGSHAGGSRVHAKAT